MPFSIFFAHKACVHEHNRNLEKRSSEARKTGYFTLEPIVQGRIVSRLDNLNRSQNRIILTIINMESGYFI